MLKIIYFDEGTATDYIDITKGGKNIQSEEIIKDRLGKALAGLGAEVGEKINLFSFLKVGASAEIGGEMSGYTNKIIKNTLSNTVLTDYIKLATKDKKIEKFKKCNIYAYKDSITSYKMYTPYTIIARQEGAEFDLSRLNEALEKARGYYEMIVEREGKMNVLRFNINAFRNNYGLSDLAKMRLTYHAIEVGECEESQLKMQNEFDFEKKSFTVDDMLNAGQAMSTKLKVYDVILAGIE